MIENVLFFMYWSQRFNATLASVKTSLFTASKCLVGDKLHIGRSFFLGLCKKNVAALSM